MRKAERNAFVVVVFLALSLLGGQAVAAPRSGAHHPHEQAASKQEPQNANAYRVTYRVSELANGKTINARSYTLMAKTGKRASTRVGSAVPYSRGENNAISYRDVGIKIDSTVEEKEGNLIVRTNLNLSTIAPERQTVATHSLPVFRNLSLADETAVTPGKPAQVGSIDAIASNHRYVIEVTVTKIM